MENSNFITQRYFSNFFEIEYTDPRSGKPFSELIRIDNYDEKITYLLKSFPYPDLVKIILEKLKFAEFQEKIILENIQENLCKDFEEHELRCLIADLNDFTSTSYYVSFFEGHFYGDHAHIAYNMRDHTKIDQRISHNWNNFHSQISPSRSDYDIKFEQDGYETD